MSKFREGETVYFLHPVHSWVLGQVTAVGKDVFTCKANDPPRSIAGDVIDKLKEDQVSNCREDLTDETVDDLLNLTILHDSTLLRCLHIRYMKDIVYTNIGAIVVALNPFNFTIPHYQDAVMPNYLAEGDRIEKNIPHSWAQAHNTFHEMINDTQNQCILISGESGAGKTEATKIVMKYLAYISCKRGSDAEKQAGMLVGTKLSACSPFLEAFGNAKTVRNDNSSRFGKFMRVKFTPSGQLVGAHTTKYLLEKSRIVTSALNERIYHAFYICVRGKLATAMGMGKDEDYVSLKAGNCLHNKEFDTSEHFDEVITAMKGVGMSEEEVKAVWATTASVMSMQNVQFAKKDEGSEIVAATSNYLNFFVDKTEVNADDLKKEMTKTTLELRGEITIKEMTLVQALDGRDALCKTLYDGTFSWLVDKSNEKCDVKDGIGNWIGLLDIFGFENFEVNSFEQLCINLANETLQNHYNNYIFSKDLEECRAEGIDVAEVKCPDNGPCLQMVSGKGGLMAILDEESSLAKGSDMGFLEKIEQAHNKNPFFEKKKLAKSSFIVKHYAGNVSYEIHGWLEKNRDTLKDAMKLVMRASKNPLIATFIPAPVDAKKLTVGGFFKEQIASLMEVINSTNPHWIRCIKPHKAKKPLHFSGVETMDQLESSGVLGTVKVRKAGYPVRTLFQKFLARYRIISGADGTPEQVITSILTIAGLNDKAKAQIGKTKVYMKSEAFPILERKRMDAFLQWSYRLQKFGRGYLGRLETFKLWMEKNRARLMAEKKAREEKERAEKERLEAERKAKEEEERAKREEEEKKKAAELAAKFSILNGAAITLQRNFRGWYTRRRVYRDIMEKERAKMERSVELQMLAWREKHHLLDRQRAAVERAWCRLLGDAENLQRLKNAESDRKQRIIQERNRIQARQQSAAELQKKKAFTQYDTVVKEIQRERNNVKQELSKQAEAKAKMDAEKLASNKAYIEARKAENMRKEIEGLLKAHRNEAKEARMVGNYASMREQAWDDVTKGYQPLPRQGASPARTFTAEPVRDRQHFQDMKAYWHMQEKWEEERERVLAQSASKAQHTGTTLGGASSPSPMRASGEYRMQYPSHGNYTPVKNTIHEMPSIRDATAMASPYVPGPRATTPNSSRKMQQDASLEMAYRQKKDLQYLFSPEKMMMQ
eukprot:PhF_6_TR36299/c0_g1_i1/m.52982/K12559/MYO10; myosin X